MRQTQTAGAVRPAQQTERTGRPTEPTRNAMGPTGLGGAFPLQPFEKPAPSSKTSN